MHGHLPMQLISGHPYNSVTQDELGIKSSLEYLQVQVTTLVPYFLLLRSLSTAKFLILELLTHYEA